MHSRFVRTPLAIIPGTATKSPELYLLEEYIGPAEGPFRKYINNGTPAILHFEDPEDRNRAKFLAFSQHYQYIKTHKTLFVSDYQG